MKTASEDAPPAAWSDLDPMPSFNAPLDGQARLWNTVEGVKLVLEVSNAPVGSRGVHVLSASSCGALPQDTAPHFAPEGDLHALPNEADAKRRHLGDLGNILVGADGKGRLEIELPRASLESGHPHSLVGKPLVLSSGQDHGQSQQPFGDSGVPIACGMIRKSTDAGVETPG